MNDEGQADRDYWNVRYAEASCLEHGEDNMNYNTLDGEWYCAECEEQEELERIYKHG